MIMIFAVFVMLFSSEFIVEGLLPPGSIHRDVNTKKLFSYPPVKETERLEGRGELTRAQELKLKLLDVELEIAAVKYCLANFGTPLPTEALSGVSLTYWENVRSYKTYTDLKALQDLLPSLQIKKNLLLQQQAGALLFDKQEVLFQYGTMKFTSDFPKDTITLKQLRTSFQKRFPDFLFKAFTISYKQKGYDDKEEEDLQLMSDDGLASYLESCAAHGLESFFYITKACKNFNDFILDEALEYATASSPNPFPLALEFNDKAFPRAIYDENGPAIAVILQHAVSDIMCKLPLFGPIEIAQSEASVRELIGPVLVAAARIAAVVLLNDDLGVPRMKIVSEQKLSGSKGSGIADYAMVYRGFNVVVITEAKKGDISYGIAQNIAQLVAGREDYVFKATSTFRSKYSELITEIDDVSSYGIVTTANNWIFTRYQVGREVCRSNEYEVILNAGTTEDNVRLGVHRIVRMLVGILNTEITEVNKNAFISRTNAAPA